MKKIEINKIIISRSDVDLVPVNKGELAVLLEQLKQFDNIEQNTNNLIDLSISNNFLKEILRLAIKSCEFDKIWV